MKNSAISFSCLLLLIFSIKAHAIGESFSIHLVHPDNDAIVASLKNDSDLTEYMKIGLNQDGKDIVLWAKKQAEIDIGDVEKASLGFFHLAPSRQPRVKNPVTKDLLQKSTSGLLRTVVKNGLTSLLEIPKK